MKILVFSDSHLNLPFQQSKCDFLKSIIEPADHVIINGDFWDGYFITFDQFIESEWKQLFPLLKKRNAVYIFGNHDRSSFADNRANLFSDTQTLQHQLESGNKLFVFEHGNRLYPTMDEKVTSARMRKFNSRIINSIERRILKRFGESPLLRIMSGKNNKIKKKVLKEIPAHAYFICGHTHCAEFDEENRFINSGFMKHGIAQYLYIQDGKVERRLERYDDLY